MNFLIVVGVLFTLALLNAIIVYHNSREYDAFDNAFMSFIVFSIIVGVFYAILTAIFVDSPARHRATLYHQNIQNLREGAQISGSFTLGSGTVNDQPVFFFYTKDDNRFTLDYRQSSITTVVEEAGVQPNILCTDWEYDNYEGYWLPFYHQEGDYKCEITVPPGTVIQNYSLGDQPVS